MKTRLNSYSRDSLTMLAKSVIKCPAEETALAKAYATAAALVRATVEVALPPKDMKVLAKYERAAVDDCIRLSGPGLNFTYFRFTKGTGPLSFGNRNFLVSEETGNAVTAWERTDEALKVATKSKLGDYEALIRNSRHFEDIVEVWPEAEKLRGDIGLNTVSVISLDVVDRIKADVASRAEAA